MYIYTHTQYPLYSCSSISLSQHVVPVDHQISNNPAVYRTSAPSFYKSKARYFPGQIGKPKPALSSFGFQPSVLEECHKENRPSASVGLISLDSDSVEHRIPSHGRRASNTYSEKAFGPKKIADSGRRDVRRMDWIARSNPFGGPKHTSVTLKHYDASAGDTGLCQLMICTQ
ncbi:hypothetical protein D915_010895 [Fasciola hepatica]|uniref:Uncharacterized protein n=1 Tax=Fasciola hepatica TaxID=6192 RepID=A0A4E0R715_FASHE|nr:hypothetical protein D915_010895 [Fasciola hepatica]